MTLTVTAAHVRLLLASSVESPVLYGAVDDTDSTLSIDVWADAYVNHSSVIARHEDVVDEIGDSPDDDTIADYLPGLQETADRIAEKHKEIESLT